MALARSVLLCVWVALALAVAPASAALAAIGAPIPGELIVKYKIGSGELSRAQAIARVPSAARLRQLSLINAEHVRFSGVSMAEAIAKLRLDPSVVYAEPNYEIHLDEIPNDPRFNELYAMRNTGQTGGIAGADIRATLAWDQFTGDPNLKVGVIDTGIDFTHPDLAANIWTNPGETPGNGVDDDHNGYVDDVHGYDFVNNDGSPMDDNGHGTHCSGTIAGVGNNGIGVAGVNWHCKLVGIKFLSGSGSGSTVGAIQAVQYAVAVGVRLTSNSWGGRSGSTALRDAIDAACTAGQLFVAAAGNDGGDNDLFPHYPSGYPSPFIISVAATDDRDQLAGFSSYGQTSVDLGAPGVNILSTLPGANYGLLSGTSMATPHVAGAVAMLMGRFPLATNLQIKELLLASTDSLPSLVGRTVTGGRLDLFRAIQVPDSLPPNAVVDLTVEEPGSTAMALAWTAPADDGADGKAAAYDLRFSTGPIDDSNFGSATRVLTPTARAAGSREHFEVTGLVPNTFYYFALRALDHVGNVSAISNLATGTTLGIPVIALSPGSFSATLLTGGVATFPLTVQNTGQGRLDFTAPSPEQFVTALSKQSAADGEAEVAMQRGAAENRPGYLGASGPDAAGYRWFDNDRPGGPGFDWVDLSSTGAPVAFANGNALSQPIELGFEFPFYGQRFRSVKVCSNGYLTFTGSTARSTNAPLPLAGAAGDLVAPFWDALASSPSQSVRVARAGGRFVVSFVGMRSGQPDGGAHTFQAILYPSGEIRYQYLSLGADRNSATVGIQAAGRAVGSLVTFNAPYLHDRQVVQFLPVQQWLSISPLSGRLAAGASTQLVVRFDAAGLPGGDFLGNVVIDSNDSTASHALLPAQLHVTAAPDLAVTPAAVEFDSLFIGAVGERSVTVRNAGTATLVVSSVATSPANFVAAGTGFNLFPDSSRIVPVSFRPTTAGGITGTLTFHSNDPDHPATVVALSGTGLVAPDISLAPDSLLASLFIGGATTRTMTITNSGGSKLIYRVSALRAPGSTAPAGVPVMAPESLQVSALNRDPVHAAPPAALSTYVGAHVAFGISALGEIMPFQFPVGNEHLQLGTFLAGYTLAYEWNGVDRLANAVFSGSSNLTPVAYVEVENSATRVVVEVKARTSDGALQVVRTFTFERASDGVRVETSVSNLSTVTASNVVYKESADWDADGQFPNTWDYDRGRNLVHASSTHFVGLASDRIPAFMDFDGWDDFARRATIVSSLSGPVGGFDGLALLHFDLGNLAPGRSDQVAVAYAAGNSLPELRSAVDLIVSSVPWMSFEPASGVVPAGASAQVTARLHADGLLDGDYLAHVRVGSNDPDEPTLSAGAHLHVTGAADISAQPDSMPFGYLYAGASRVDTLVIRNSGTATLAVSGVTVSPAAFSAPAAGFVLAPGELRRIVVRYAPSVRGVFDGALVFASNDPDEAAFRVPLHGFARIPPDIQLQSDSLLADLITGETAVRTVQLANTGGGELFWDATVGERTVLEASPRFGPSSLASDKVTQTRMPPPPDLESQYRALIPSAQMPAPLYSAEAAVAATSLETALAHLDAGASAIVSDVPDHFEFSEGVTGSFIDDGGFDMYDGGNFLGTNFGGLIYSDGVIQSSATFGPGGRYFTRKYPGLFLLAAEMNDVTSFAIGGNLGADGAGGVDGSILQITSAGATYRAFVKRVFHAGDPSVNHMIIVADDPRATHSFATDTNDDFHKVDGLLPARRIYYLLYAGSAGRYINDAETQQIFATFLRVLDPSPTWLRIAPSAGVLSPGGQTTLQAGFNSAGLPSGNFLTELRFHSDDPDESDLRIPARLHVTGAPDITVLPDSLRFPELFVGLSQLDSVEVANDGSDPLTVTGVTVTPADYVVPTGGFTLPAGARRRLPVRFAPLAPGLKAGTLSIASDDHDEPVVQVALLGTGLAAPNIVVSPDSLVASLLTGDTLRTELTIHNSGGNTLTFAVSPTFLNAAVTSMPQDQRLAQLQRVVSVIPPGPWPGASPAARQPAALGADVVRAAAGPEALDRVLVLTTTALNGSVERALTELGQPYDIVFTSSFRFVDFTPYRTVIVGMDGGPIEQLDVAALATATAAGRRLIMMGGTNYDPYYLGVQSYLLHHAGIPGWSTSPTPHFTVVEPFDPLAVGLPATTNFADGNATYHSLRIDDPEATVVARNGAGWPALCRKRIGAGTLVYFANDPYTGFWSFPQDYAFLKQVVQNSLVAENWLSFEPTSGEVAPGATLAVSARFDPGQLLGGDYFATVQVHSNDPEQPLLSIPAHLHVTGTPDIVVAPDTIRFSTLFVGAAHQDSVVVRNIGTDVLSVSLVASSSGEFLAPGVSFGLVPGAQRLLRVWFAPTTPGTKAADLTITSDDPDHPTIVVRLFGEALVAPDIAVSPDSLVASLFAGDSLETALTIRNTGGSPLFWSTSFTSAAVLSTTAVFQSAAIVTDKTVLTAAPPAPDGAAVHRDPAPMMGAAASAMVSLASATPLSSVLTHLDESSDAISALIPARYDFFEGDFGGSIGDGGDDMYDGGNFLSTSRGGFNYSNGVIVPSPSFGPSGRYFTRKYTGLFVLVADLDSISQFSINGNLGADGSGSVDGAVLRATSGGVTYRAFVKRVFAAGDPSVNHMIIVSDAPSSTHAFSVNTDDDFHQVSGLAGAGRIYYLLYAGQFGAYIDNAAASRVLEKFLDVVNPTPAWLTALPGSGDVAPGGLQDVQITFRTGGLPPGDYRSTLRVSSNDPDESVQDIPAHLHVIGTPRVAAQPTSLSFGEVFLGATKTDSVTISNIGSDVLHVSEVRSTVGRFVVPTAPFDLAPAGRRKLAVTFTPTVVGAVADSLVLVSNDVIAPHFTVALFGSAVPVPIASLAPDSLVLNVPPGGVASATVTLQNSGDGLLRFTAGRGPAVLASAAQEPVVSESIEPHRDGPVVGSAPSDPMQASEIMFGEPRAAITAASNVLVIADGGTETDVTAILTAAGYIVTTVADDGVWDGTNPSPSDFSAVVLLDGPGVGNDMPAGGQSALLSYVSTGGGLIVMEWAAFEVSAGRYAALRPLIPIDWGVYADGVFTWSVAVSHPITLGVQPTFNVSTTADVGTLNSGTALVVSASGNPMVTVKDIGAGRVVHFASAGNYFGYRPFATLNMQRLLVNSADFLSGSHWLTVTPDSGVVPPHTSLGLNVNADGSLLTAGVHRASIQVATNDPARPRLTVPVRLVVGGTPSLMVTPDTVRFASAYLGATPADSVVITNAGVDVLSVTQLTSSGAFRVPAVAFNLPAGGRRSVPLTFMPTAAGDLAGTLIIHSNDPGTPVRLIALKGRALPAPEAALAPLSFGTMIAPTSSAVTELVIENRGASPLRWSLGTLAAGQGASTTVAAPARSTRTDRGAGVSGSSARASRPGADPSAAAAPATASVAWLTVEPGAGTVQPHTLARVRVGYDARGLVPGVYEAQLIASTDDPLHLSSTIPVHLTVGSTAAVGTSDDLRLALHGFMPNPPVRELMVSLTLPDAAPATLALLDLAGRRLRAVEVGARGAGQHVISLGDRHGLPSGVYLVRLLHSGQAVVAKCVIMR